MHIPGMYVHIVRGQVLARVEIAGVPTAAVVNASRLFAAQCAYGSLSPSLPLSLSPSVSLCLSPSLSLSLPLSPSLPPSVSLCFRLACGVVVLCIDLCVSDCADTVQMSHAGSDRLVLLDMLGLTLFLSVCPSLCRSRSLSLSVCVFLCLNEPIILC